MKTIHTLFIFFGLMLCATDAAAVLLGTKPHEVSGLGKLGIVLLVIALGRAILKHTRA